MTARRWPVVAAVWGLLVFGACGCGRGSTSTISASASAQLTNQVDAVRVAAAAHDPATAGVRLAQLRAMVSTLQAQGSISGSRAAQILAAASDVANQLGTISVPTVPTTVAADPITAGSKPGGGKGGGKGGDGGGGGGGD